MCWNCHSPSLYHEDLSKWRDFVSRRKIFEDPNLLDKPKMHCWFCDSEHFTEFSSKKFHELKEEGKIKPGFFITENFKFPKQKKCDHKINTLVRHNEYIFKAECIHCGEEEYVDVSKWKQEKEDWLYRNTLSFEEILNRDKDL